MESLATVVDSTFLLPKTSKIKISPFSTSPFHATSLLAGVRLFDALRVRFCTFLWLLLLFFMTATNPNQLFLTLLRAAKFHFLKLIVAIKVANWKAHLEQTSLFGNFGEDFSKFKLVELDSKKFEELILCSQTHQSVS